MEGAVGLGFTEDEDGGFAVRAFEGMSGGDEVVGFVRFGQAHEEASGRGVWMEQFKGGIHDLAGEVGGSGDARYRDGDEDGEEDGADHDIRAGGSFGKGCGTRGGEGRIMKVGAM
jgi:hypothetical protein